MRCAPVALRFFAETERRRDATLRESTLTHFDPLAGWACAAFDELLVAAMSDRPVGFKEHGRFEQPDRSDKKAWPYPVIAHGKLYLRDMDTLLCYDVKAK